MHMRIAVIIGIVSILVASALAASFARYAGSDMDPQDVEDLAFSPTESGRQLQPVDVPDGYVMYTNERLRFSLYHPEHLTVSEYDEGHGAVTVTFEDTAAGEGIQMFIIPYAEPQVTEARFHADVPSGVRTDVRQVTVGGATAASFFSTHPVLGDTAEVWFIHNGYLYEATAPRSSAPLLSAMLLTFRFADANSERE